MLDKKQLDSLSNSDIKSADLAALVDINTITISQDTPVETRLVNFMEQIGNPYCFKCGDIPVRVRFASSSRTLSEALGTYFRRLK